MATRAGLLSMAEDKMLFIRLDPEVVVFLAGNLAFIVRAKTVKGFRVGDHGGIHLDCGRWKCDAGSLWYVRSIVEVDWFQGDPLGGRWDVLAPVHGFVGLCSIRSRLTEDRGVETLRLHEKRVQFFQAMKTKLDEVIAGVLF